MELEIFVSIYTECLKILSLVERYIYICRILLFGLSITKFLNIWEWNYNLLGWQIWTVFWCLPPLMWAETFMESSPFNFPSSSVSTLPATTNWSPGSGKEKSSLSEEKERKIFPHLPLKRMWEFLSEILDWSTTLGPMYLKKINFASRSLPLKNWEV